jgi:uncharacterized protein YbcI
MAGPVATANHRATSPAATISTGVVGVVHEYTGRGPTKARTTIDQNTVIVMMGDTLTKSERKLAEDGKSDLVYEIRHQFQGTMREDLIDVVESALGRKVIAFMSANHLDPDLAAEVFVLEPLDSVT